MSTQCMDILVVLYLAGVLHTEMPTPDEHMRIYAGQREHESLGTDFEG
jgi:hypothetical protein